MADQNARLWVVSPRLPVGTPVVVRTRFMGNWSRGFEVARHAGDGYVIRRSSDKAILPEVIGPDEVQPARQS